MTSATPSPQIQSEVTSYAQQHQVNIQAVSAFKAIIRSCYGPYGCTKMIQNQCGGHVSVTSSSHRLLNALSLSKPILKLISAAVEAHLDVKSDGGLYAALLACSLIEACWDTGLPPALCVSVNEVMKDLCMMNISSMDVCRISLNMSSTDGLISIARSVISSKPGCGLVKHEEHLLSRLIVQSFLSSLPTDAVGQYMSIPDTQIVGVEGQAVSESHVKDGVLVEAPNIPAFSTRDLQLLRLETGHTIGCVRVVLFNISLAGDSQEYAEARYEIATEITPEASAVSAIRDLVDQFLEMRVGLVACQKVVHPSVKHHLREKGILCLDRLSVLHIGAVQRITGAEMLSSFCSPILLSHCGHLTDIKRHVMFGRSYLHLMNTSSPQHTMVLCNHTEEALQELKHVCQVAHQTLALTLSDPTAVLGAGCLELVLAHQVRQQTASLHESAWKSIGCTKMQFLHLAETFASCLEAVCMAMYHEHGQLVTDSHSHHGWLLPQGTIADPDWLHGLQECCCGMKLAKDLGDSEWSMVGTLRCGVHKVEEKPVRETDSLVGQEKNLSPRKVEKDTCSDSVCDAQNAEHAMLSTCKMPNHQGRQEKCREMILDLYSVKYGAFCVAVDTANVVLRVGHIVEDIY